ncbi:PAS domain-containing protein [Sphingomonas sp.]|uniref:hybrid sensor histidine kinase/response regulator n=1 Tax=Sphingomonas sp. TaxID=28214 RepID=UPI00286BDFA0|nr:PAS domain-containing protein [Sphingomonas sp.]
MARDRNDDSSDTGRFDFAQMLAVADALPVALAFVDREFRYRFVNRALAEFLERSRGELLGLTMAEVLDPKAMADRRPMLDAALAGERQWFAADFDHPTRGPLAIQSEYLPQVGSDGNVFGLVLLISDVTEQRVSERALKESEARFRRIADSAPVPMWVTRLDRSRDFVNQAYVELMGVDAEQSRRIDWMRRVHPDDKAKVIEDTIAGEKSGGSFVTEARFERRPGDWRWMRAVSQPRFGPDGDLIGYIGVSTDITLAKQSEIELRTQVEERTAELQASEARVRAIFDTVLEVIVLLEPDGTILEINRVSTPWRDTNPERSLGGKIWDAPTMLAYPEHIPAMKAAVASAAKGEPFNGEFKMERAGVATAYLDYSIQPIRDDHGEIIYLLAEARDITDLKAAQEQLRQSQKMEALGQLTGGIAHDFNNLLTVVVGGLDMILRNVTDERLKRYATNALTAAERGARLTAQLLAFSRVQRLEVRATDVAPLIEGMRPLLGNVLGPSIVKKFKLHDERMPVMADPTQLELAVLNLAINARDAMPDGGKLTIATKAVQIVDDPELEDGDYLELCVNDTGTGMPPDVVARAFDPFFTTKEVGKGTGLGLSMVYGVARQSGGTARIDSAPGEGTTIKLYFKCADGDAEGELAKADVNASEPAIRNASILVIDDDPDVREFIVSSLGDYGYRVRAAADGVEGLEMFGKQRPDLVVLDYAMPGLSGGEVAAQILNAVPGQPILFVSGYSESEAISSAAPLAQMLAKPFRPDALDAAVREALGQGT